MKNPILMLLLVLAAAPAAADLVASTDSGETRLMAAPCDHPAILFHLNAATAARKPQKLRSIDGWTVRGGCWLREEDGSLTLLHEDGTVTNPPASRFRDDRKGS